jgi:microcystin-dependent protein
MAEKNFTVNGSIVVDDVTVDLSATQLGSSLHRVGNTVTAKRETPIGTVVMYTGLINGSKTNVPSGWLLCDGTETSVSSYPDLDTVVGTRYGARTNGSGGAGTSHFRLPNLTERLPIGHIQTNTDAPNTLSSSTDSTTLSSHSHTSNHNSSEWGDGTGEFLNHTHVVTTGNSGHNHGASGASSSTGTHQLTAAGQHTHQHKQGNIGASFAGSDSNHTHNMNTDSMNHSHTDIPANSLLHQHNSNAASLDHAHTVTVSTSDGNQSMSNASHQHTGGFSAVRVFFIIKAQHGV